MNKKSKPRDPRSEYWVVGPGVALMMVGTGSRGRTDDGGYWVVGPGVALMMVTSRQRVLLCLSRLRDLLNRNRCR